MQKVLFMNLDLIKDSICKDKNVLNSFKQELKNMSDNKVCFYSRDVKIISSMAQEFGEDFHFKTRVQVENIIGRNPDKKNICVVIGRKDRDFFLAVNNKLLFIVPMWMELEEKACKYGIRVDTPAQLFKFIGTLNNQNYWYSNIKVDEKTTVLSLMDAKYKNFSISQGEAELIKNFQSLLKTGNSRNYYDILLYHFLAGMTGNKIFDDIKIWGIIPSSNGMLNPDMMNFKNCVRYIMKCQEPKDNVQNNILIRHTRKMKAHDPKSMYDREQMGASIELKTIMVNPIYKEKIKKLKERNEFNVCIFDDYMTHGNSFEAVRNIFEYLGADKIICVSLGSFCREYKKNDYFIKGDVYDNKFAWELKNQQMLQPEINKKAKIEIDNLYQLFNLGMR